MSRVGETGVGETGVGEMGVGETGTNHKRMVKDISTAIK